MAFLPQKNFFEEDLLSSYDLSLGVTQPTSSDLSNFNIISLHFVYSNTDGSNLFILEQSNDGSNWSNLSRQYNIPVGSGNFIIDKSTFTGKFIRVNLISINSGTLSIKLLSKR